MPEDGYMFGTGVLTMHVAEVIDRRPVDGVVWVDLRGHEVHPDGSVRARPRHVSVRLDRVTVVRGALR
ncbi:hypothetical protein ACN26Y_06245 [Micromonospora sp. WMMD558]|uniref:hypothetical protein n=1 Tax=Micromonospora sp. WMMD558 TaxID=3403462 RepID=UPI003BF4A5BA